MKIINRGYHVTEVAGVEELEVFVREGRAVISLAMEGQDRGRSFDLDHFRAFVGAMNRTLALAEAMEHENGLPV